MMATKKKTRTERVQAEQLEADDVIVLPDESEYRLARVQLGVNYVRLTPARHREDVVPKPFNCPKGDVVREADTMKRTPLRRGLGRRKKASAAAEAEFRSALVHRSYGTCEASDIVVDRVGWAAARQVCGTGIHHNGAHAHHLWPEDRDRGVHDPSRGLFLCASSHAWAHEHPALAKSYGLLRPEPFGGAA